MENIYVARNRILKKMYKFNIIVETFVTLFENTDFRVLRLGNLKELGVFRYEIFVHVLHGLRLAFLDIIGPCDGRLEKGMAKSSNSNSRWYENLPTKSPKHVLTL